MRWSRISLILLPLLIASTAADWSWGDDKTKEVDSKPEATDLLEGEEIAKAEEKSDSSSNATVLDDIVDEIISSKQGRSLGGFDDVYADPTIKEALDSGDDSEARNLIKERLCTLGLMQCDDDGVQEKRPYVSPDDLIYAQPVDIKPIGRPIASIPIRGPPRAYGPAKPMPYPPRPQMVPPKRVGYGGQQRPGFSDKYGQVNGGNYQNTAFNGFNEGSYLNKPNPNYAGDNPYNFDNIKAPKPIYKPQQSIPVSSPIQNEPVVQQHVHHHYVHGEGNKDPKVIIKPVAIPVGSVGSLASVGSVASSGIHSSGNKGPYLEGFDEFDNGGFKPMNGIYSQNTKPIYENSEYSFNKGSLNQNGFNQLNGPYASNFDGNSLGAYGSQDFYKKELQVGTNVNNIYNRGPATYTQGQSYETHEPREQQFDCVCVNYDQCPGQEIIGKRDDLILPIDPRNKGSDIDALSEEQLENVTLTDAAPTTNTKIEYDRVSDTNATDTDDIKKVSKREVKEDTKEDSSKKIEPRLIGLAGIGGNGGNGNKNVQPTFGVSFGLPQAHGSYPLNPFDFNPIHNPYGPALNAGGLNLGLISVSPLISLQVTKNDYGEKVIKPLVNLHVTPNEHVVNKLGNLFHEKKHYLLNKHEHYHNYHHQPHYRPSYGYAPLHSKPHVYTPQHHSSNHYYPPSHYSEHNSQPNYYGHYAPEYYNRYANSQNYIDNNNNEYDDDADTVNYDNEGLDFNTYTNFGNYYGRNVNNTDAYQGQYADQYNTNSRILTIPSNPHGSGLTRGGKAVRFPDSRKKRDVEPNFKSDSNAMERQGYFGRPQQQCRANQVCCRRPLVPQAGNRGQCGLRHSQGINGRIKTPAYVDGDSEFGEYPWQAAILKKDPKESVYVCGGTLIDHLHIVTAAHCVKQYQGHELRIRLGEWDVNHDVEFYPYVERDVLSVHVHPQYYAGTLDNDLAILKLQSPVDWTQYPHISPACLPDKYTDYAGQRCWTTGWGKDAFGDFGKYQNILKEVDVPVLSHGQCQQQLKQTRLGYNYQLNPGFLCAGGEEGKDACKGDGGGPLVCEKGGTWQVVGVVSWGIGCGQVNVPGVYVKVAHYLDWISQVTGRFSYN